ncbi:hypothetical protein [Streptomyces mirabilis]|uniref:hypothetical protein n=1 Tax=Streptomyces mirabilis TaxID=68239 RepID=UPI00332A1D84
MNDTYAFIEAEKTTHGVAFLCRLLKVARSSFYAWLAAQKTRAARQAAEAALTHEITVIHLASRGTDVALPGCIRPPVSRAAM